MHNHSQNSAKCYNCQEYKTSLWQESSVFLSGESLYPSLYQKRNDRLQASLGWRVKKKVLMHDRKGN